MIDRRLAILILAAVSAWAVKAQTTANHLASATPQPAEVPTFSFPAGKIAVHVPFELLGNAIFVSARVNGKGPFLFTLDSGSCCSSFAAEFADELGMHPQGEMKGMGAGSSSNKMGLVKGTIEFTFPNGLKLSTEDANTISYAGLWPLIGRPFYGNIGYDVLKDVVVEIDYDKRIITFYSAATYKYSEKGQVFQTKLWMNYDPQFEGTFTLPGVSPVASVFTLDTGAGGTIINSPMVKTLHLVETMHDKLPSPSHGLGAGVSNDLIGRFASIDLGPYKLQRPVVALSQDTEGSLAMEAIGVNLGGNVLRRFTVTINYPGGTIALEPNSHFADPFLADASGLVLNAEGGDFRTFVVQDVVSDSPAAKIALQRGDVIIAIDDKPAKAIALWELQDQLKNSGHKAKLKIRRGSHSFVCELMLRSLV
jgi:PDZ domain